MVCGKYALKVKLRKGRLFRQFSHRNPPIKMMINIRYRTVKAALVFLADGGISSHE